jgi:hypothetical protein
MIKLQSTDHQPFYRLLKTWDPVRFQGGNQKSRYFEGWYFKNVSSDSGHIWSVIPGISIVDKNRDHAFIQLINGKTADTWYVRFPISEFRFSEKKFEVSIGKNHFSFDGFSLDIDDESIDFRANGQVNFEDVRSLKSTLFNPGIMGWYSFMPFMECYHGLVSMNHSLNGQLKINNETCDFAGGKGYSEKDWGRSMPSAWIWLQCNHFVTPGISIIFSVAKIPWIRNAFTGFLCVLLFEGKIHRFATYTGAKISEIKLEGESVFILIHNKKHILEITACRAGHGLLAAPVNGAMDRRIAESVDASITLKISDKSGNLIFAENGINAGLELVGDMKDLPV